MNFFCKQPKAFLVLSLIFLTTSAMAGSSVFGSFSIDYDQNLIASDAQQGGSYDRDAIHATANMSWAAAPANQYTFELRFYLWDSTNTPVQIYDENGLPNTVYTVPKYFSNLGAGVGTLDNVDLVPVNQLDHHETYTPRLEVYETYEGGAPVGPNQKIVQNAGNYTFHHYTSTNASDSALNVLSSLDTLTTGRKYIVATDSSKTEFDATVNFTLHRHDDYFGTSNPAPSDNVKVRVNLDLVDSGGTSVPLTSSYAQFTVNMDRYDYGAGVPPRQPAQASFTKSFTYKPSSPTSLVIGETYTLNVTIAHEDVPGSNSFGTANSLAGASTQLRYLNGNVYFNGILSTVNSVNYVQVPGTVSGGIATGLLVPAVGGGVVGSSGHTYGGAPMTVDIHSNGNAYFTGAAPGVSQVALNPATVPDMGNAGGVKYERSNLTLSSGGLQGNLTLCLPAGLGYTVAPHTKVLDHFISYPTPLAYSSSVTPVSTSLNFSMYTNTWFVEESKPLMFGISTVQWNLGSGSLTLTPGAANEIEYVRTAELDLLESATGLENSDGSLKRSNDLYWRKVDTIDTPVITVTTGSGGSAQVTFDVSLENTGANMEFFTHFPYDAHITWNGAASLSVAQDVIDPTLSSMTGVGDITLDYSRDCGGADCGTGIGPGTVPLTPDAATLVFTEDGGLVGSGTMASTDLTWGYIPSMGAYAQTAFGFTSGVFAASGHFQAGPSLTVPADRGAGSILLSGAETSGSVTERPGTGAYLDGDAWYAGHNFQVASDGANDGNSVLAGNTSIPNYDLTHRSKYYIRKSGVTGVHQAMSGEFNPPDIYGYNMTFDEFGNSYLNSQQLISVTWGNLDVPAPAGFNLDFENVKVDCLGALTGADIEDNLDKTLAYWNGDFTALGLSFERNASAVCDPGEGFLAVGAAASISHIDDLFYGTLGFKPDGNLITAEDNLVDGLDSRLAGPNRVHFDGYDDERYSLDLATKLFYNNKDHAGAAEGWLNLVGRLDVPFFEDMKVHLQTRGDKDSTIAPLYLMGGWPDHGYGTATDNFFTKADFDDDHKAYDSGTVDNYRNSGSETYLPRAQQNWLSVVNFDYPMQWSDFDRRFTSQGAHQDKFLIVDVEHDLPTLSARQAEMTFGASWDGLPFLSFSGLASKLVDDQVMRPFRAAVDEGKDAMAEMLSDQVQKLFDPVLDELLAPLTDEIYDAMKEQYETAALANGTPINELMPFAAWQAVYNDVVTCYLTGGTLPVTSPVDCPMEDSLLEIFENVIGAVDDVSGLLSQIDNYLEKTELVLDAFTSSFKDPEGKVLSDTQGMFVCDANGDLNFAFAEELLKRLISKEDLGVDPAIIGHALDNLLHPLLDDHKLTLKALAEKLLKLKVFIGTVRENLATASDFVANLQDQLALVNSQVNDVITTVDGAVQSFFTEMESMSTMAGSPFDEYTKEEITAFLTAEIKDAFYSSEIGTRLQVVIKQQLFDTNGAICQGIDNVFAELNKVTRDLISAALQDLDESILPFLDKLNGVVGAGKLTGYAHIVDDAIRYARMDAHLEWSVPKKMDFDGFIEIKQLNAEGSGNACYANSPGVINEVTVGANHVPINWGNADMKADIYGKATFDTTSGLELLGIGGGFEMVEGEIKFEKFTITELGAALSLGEKEAFLAAKAHATFDSVEAGIGAFFGKTCTIEPLAMVDADVASVLGDAPFTGAYLYGEAWLPIFNYGCALRVSAGAGIGLGYFNEGPTYVGKMKLGVSGEAICVVSVRGELVLIGVKQGSDFRFKGTGTISGSVGKCKWFCIKFKKSITVEK